MLVGVYVSGSAKGQVSIQVNKLQKRTKYPIITKIIHGHNRKPGSLQAAHKEYAYR